MERFPDHAEAPGNASKDGEAVDGAASAAEYGAENVHSSDPFDGSAPSAPQDAENDPLSTTAMAPIDVSGLRPGDLPSMPELSMPSLFWILARFRKRLWQRVKTSTVRITA